MYMLYMCMAICVVYKAICIMKPQQLDTHVHVDQHTNVTSSVEEIHV